MQPAFWMATRWRSTACAFACMGSMPPSPGRSVPIDAITAIPVATGPWLRCRGWSAERPCAAAARPSIPLAGWLPFAARPAVTSTGRWWHRAGPSRFGGSRTIIWQKNWMPQRPAAAFGADPSTARSTTARQNGTPLVGRAGEREQPAEQAGQQRETYPSACRPLRGRVGPCKKHRTSLRRLRVTPCRDSCGDSESSPESSPGDRPPTACGSDPAHYTGIRTAFASCVEIASGLR